MIEFTHVSKKLGGKAVLKNLSFKIEKGETFVIVGSSGTGKSVTLKHMVRLLTPDNGEVLVGEDQVSSARGKDLERIRDRFGYLFQSSALMQWLSVRDNVGLPLREKTKLSQEEIDKKVAEKLEMVTLQDALGKMPSELSGGMRKRVALARAIIMDPEIILYDEPTSGLDPVTSRTIDRMINELRRELGITSVVVTHDLHSALAIGTRIGMLHGGNLVEVAKPEDFIHSEQKHVIQFLKAQHISQDTLDKTLESNEKKPD